MSKRLPEYPYTAVYGVQTAESPDSVDASLASVAERLGTSVDELFGISEAASKKRGRPKVMHEVFRGFCESHFRHVRTDRGRQNLKYAYHAIHALDVGPEGKGLVELGWLVDWDAADRYSKGSIKWGVLAELGRFAERFGPEAAVMAASTLKAAAPRTTKETIGLLREWRLRSISKRDDFRQWRASKRNDTALVKRLAAVTDQYRAEHPEMTDEELLSAINNLYCLCAGD